MAAAAPSVSAPHPPGRLGRVNNAAERVLGVITLMPIRGSVAIYHTVRQSRPTWHRRRDHAHHPARAGPPDRARPARYHRASARTIALIGPRERPDIVSVLRSCTSMEARAEASASNWLISLEGTLRLEVSVPSS